MAAAVATGAGVDPSLGGKEDSGATSTATSSVDPTSGALVNEPSAATAANDDDNEDAPDASASGTENPEEDEDSASSSFDLLQSPSPGPKRKWGVGGINNNNNNSKNGEKTPLKLRVLKNIKRTSLSMLRSSSTAHTIQSSTDDEETGEDVEEKVPVEPDTKQPRTTTTTAAATSTVTTLFSPNSGKPKKTLKARLNLLRTSAAAKTPSEEETKRKVEDGEGTVGDTEIVAAAIAATTDGPKQEAAADIHNDADSGLPKAPRSPTKRAKALLTFHRQKPRSKSPPTIRNSKKKEMEARKLARHDILGRIGGVLGESATGGPAAEGGGDSMAFLVDSADPSASLELPPVAPALDDNSKPGANDSKMGAERGGRFAKMRERARNLVKRPSAMFQGRNKADEAPEMMMMEDTSSEFMVTDDSPSLAGPADGPPRFSTLPRPSLEQEAGDVKTLPRPSLEITHEEEEDDEEGNDEDLTLNDRSSSPGMESTITERRRLRQKRKSVSHNRVVQSIQEPQTPLPRVRLQRRLSKNPPSTEGRSGESNDNDSVGDAQTPRTQRLRRQNSKSGPSDDASTIGNDDISVADSLTPRRRGVRRQHSRSGPSDEASTIGNDDNSVGDPQTPRRRGVRRQDSRNKTIDDKELNDEVMDPETPETRRRLRRHNSKTNPSQQEDAAAGLADDNDVGDLTPQRRRLKRRTSRTPEEIEESRGKEERRRTHRSDSPSRRSRSGRHPESPRKGREKRTQSPKDDVEKSLSPRSKGDPDTPRKSLSPPPSPNRREKEKEDDHSRRRRVRSGSPGRSHPSDSRSKSKSRPAHRDRSREQDRTPKHSKENRESDDDSYRKKRESRSMSPTSTTSANKNKDDHRRRRHEQGRSHNADDRRPLTRRETGTMTGDRSVTSKTGTSRRPNDDRSVASAQVRRRHQQSRRPANGSCTAGRRSPSGSPKSPLSPSTGKTRRRVTKANDLGARMEKLEAFEWT